MGYRYSYNPKRTEQTRKVREHYHQHKKNVLIAVIVLAALGVTAGVAQTMTGFATYIDAVESDLALARQDLAAAVLATESCKSTLDKTETSLKTAKTDAATCTSTLENSHAELVSCEGEKSELNAYADELNNLYGNCQEDRDAYRSDLEREISMKNSIIKNAVRSFCCSFNDIKNGAEKHWDVDESGNIVCSGEKTVSCAA